MPEVVWTPDEATLERANVVRLMRRHGIDDYRKLVARSIDDPEWFWPAAVEDMGIEFAEPWRQVVDDSRGPEWATWFVGGKLNIAWNCVHRWAAERAGETAAVFRGEDGARRELTFGEQSAQVTKLAEALVRLGVEPGDRVAIYLPMSPEVAIASHACAHIGAVQVPIFSGFAAPAVAQRLTDSEAKVAITVESSLRRGRQIPMLATLEEARREAPSLEHIVLAPFDELLADCPGELDPLAVDSEHPYLLTYTSGTTGRPKGVLHVQGGFLVSIAREVCYQADARPGDVFHFATDMGWIMGPWTVVGGGAMGATIVYAEGAPDWPADRLWRLVEEEGVSILGCSPTLIRALIPHGEPAHDLSSLAHHRHHRGALESRPVPLAVRQGGRRPLPDHQLLGRDRGRRVLPVPHAGDSDQGVLRRRARYRHGDGRRRRRRAARSSGRARSASSSAASRSRA